jgi:hypothetical protein
MAVSELVLGIGATGLTCGMRPAMPERANSGSGALPLMVITETFWENLYLMSGKHSAMLRGIAAAGENPEFQGRFGRLFPDLSPATYGTTQAEEEANLAKLADAMVSEFDAPKDGPDAEESGIPSLYTYFGQFVDHDLTFDPSSSFQKQKDPDAGTDFRSPAFDLDNVYGRGPGDQPYMYDTDGKSFLLGDPITQGRPSGAHDLQRNAAGRALIGDPRNDENAIVSQLQGLFLRLHNRLVTQHGNLSFDQVQQVVRHHYQYIVLNDFLPRIVTGSVPHRSPHFRQR